MSWVNEGAPNTTADTFCRKSLPSFWAAAIASSEVLFSVPALCSMKTKIPPIEFSPKRITEARHRLSCCKNELQSRALSQPSSQLVHPKNRNHNHLQLNLFRFHFHLHVWNAREH